MTLYKILVDGKSCHGGTLEWPLPNDGEPGDWVKVDGKIEMCKRGIHLTQSPFKWYKIGCKAYEAEILTTPTLWEDDKCCVAEARLLRLEPWPKPWEPVEAFLGTIKDVPWFKPDGKPDPEWKLFTAPTLAAARDAAGAAAGAAAGDAAGAAAGGASGAAAWDAARAASLLARCLLVSDLPPDKFDPKHLAHARARWAVWQKGYAPLCDVDGVLYVYAKEIKP